MIKTNPKSVEAYTLMHQGSLAFSKAELNGIRVDVDYIEKKNLEPI